MSFHLLQEDGSKLLLEDESGSLLLEEEDVAYWAGMVNREYTRLTPGSFQIGANRDANSGISRW